MSLIKYEFDVIVFGKGKMCELIGIYLSIIKI